MVLSDPHVYAKSLGASGRSFAAMQRDGSKLLALSEEIFAAALDAAAAMRPDFLLVCGDLTKDGERESHLEASSLLRNLEARGVPVYVVPGNHDIRNPHARGFAGDTAVRVENIGPADFHGFYADFGSAEAIERDPSSFSYAAEPVPGLRILALDTCRYGQDGTPPTGAGRLSPATRAWAAEAAGRARRDGATILAFAHHGFTEHFRGQTLYYGENLVADPPSAARFLAEAGIEVVFTGHGHAQDAAEVRWTDGLGLLDVETGSLVSHPCPLRLVTLTADGILDIRSLFVADLPGAPEGLARTARDGLARGIRMRVLPPLQAAGVAARDAERIAAAATEGMIAFFRGDEPGPGVPFPPDGLDPWSAVVAGILSVPFEALGSDLPPADNDLKVRLRR